MIPTGITQEMVDDLAFIAIIDVNTGAFYDGSKCPGLGTDTLEFDTPASAA